MIEEGSIWLAVVAAFLFLGGLLIETRVLLRWRRLWYFSLGVPVLPPPVPIVSVPRGAGRTESVRWEVVAPGVVLWWADPDERAAPTGLHGTVFLAQLPAGGVALDVRFAPPLSPILAAVWLGALGVARGEAQVTIPIALAIALGLGVLYYDRARRAARELRWAFANGDGG